jgi:hypothetical protein
MSKIALTPNASGTGTFTIASPNSNTDRTLTLPDAAGTVLVDDGSGNVAVTGDLTIADKIVHSGDTNTAVRFPAADTVTVETAGSEAVRVTSSGDVGIGTSSPATKLHVDGTFATSGNTSLAGTTVVRAINICNPEIAWAQATNTSTFLNFSDTGGNNGSNYTFSIRGLTSSGTAQASLASFQVDASSSSFSGSLSKGSGMFKIEHPLKPETHHLVHSFIEGPQADNIYRGRAALTGGTATVNLDQAARMTEGTFVALNGNVQCFTSNEDGWTAVRGTVNGNILTIEAQDAACTDTVSWLVIGERHDQHMIDTNWTDDQGRVITEPEKEASA